MEEPSVTEEEKYSTHRSTKKPKKSGKKCILNVSDTKYSIVRIVGKKVLGWKLSKDEDDENWDVWWTDGGVQPEKLSKMKGFQKINHFPGMVAISRKNQLARNLTRMKKAFPKEYNFFPQTWLLPSEYTELRKKFGANRKNVFIVKPEASCQGRGIFLTKRLDDIDTTEQHYVVQQYLKRPLLIDNLKFDLRIYVLIAGCDPLRIYVHEYGLTRFATVEYKAPSAKNMNNMCMHLTNYAVNKNNPNFTQPGQMAEDGYGHKRTLASTYAALEDMGHDVEKIKNRIHGMIVKTLCAVQPSLAHIYRSCQPDDPTNGMCFEILGLDVMLDTKLKPYIIEVNHSPSFTTDSPLDKEIKKRVIGDTLNLLNVQPSNRKAYFDRKQKDAVRRTLNGRNIRESKENRMELCRKAQITRDAYESKNIGGFTKIYPLGDTTKFEEYIAEADRIWQNWTGARTYNRKPSSETKADQPTPGPNAPSTSLPPRIIDPPKMMRQRQVPKLVRPRTGSFSKDPVEEEAPEAPQVFERLASKSRQTAPLQAPSQLYSAPSYFPEVRFDTASTAAQNESELFVLRQQVFGHDPTVSRQRSHEKFMRKSDQLFARNRFLTQSTKSARATPVVNPGISFEQRPNPNIGSYVTPKVLAFAPAF